LLIPAHGYLTDLAAFFDDLLLAFDFIGDGVAYGAEGIEVFDFHLGAKLVRALGSDRDIGFAAHCTLFHIA
jgi:hypothetical protein